MIALLAFVAAQTQSPKTIAEFDRDIITTAFQAFRSPKSTKPHYLDRQFINERGQFKSKLDDLAAEFQARKTRTSVQNGRWVTRMVEFTDQQKQAYEAVCLAQIVTGHETSRVLPTTPFKDLAFSNEVTLHPLDSNQLILNGKLNESKLKEFDEWHRTDAYVMMCQPPAYSATCRYATMTYSIHFRGKRHPLGADLLVENVNGQWKIIARRDWSYL